MKIANLVCAWPPYAGGMGNSAKIISDIIGEKNEVINFYPDNLKPFLRRGHAAFSPSLFFKLRKFNYIYLHYPFFGTAEVVWFFKLFFKKPKLIIHYHMDVKNNKSLEKILSLPSRLTRNSLLNQAELIISASLDYVKNSQIKDYYAKHPEKFQEIPFGVDLEKFCPKEVKRPAKNKIIAKTQELINFVNDKFIKRDKTELLFVGGLDKAHYFKGIDLLLEALSFLREKDWALTIIGDGDLRSSYERKAYELALDKKVSFKGKLSDPDLIRAYQDSDLLILPSINNNEAFGIVLIEALACGTPVLSSDLPGVRKVFRDSYEGLLFKTGDKEDLKLKLEYFLSNRDTRRQLSAGARMLAEKKYDLKEMSKKINQIFI